ncbi:L-aspartate oxidase [Gloeomargarita lithophora Alchichica-D10]|uniref:L-aspartate oxidase n=1 Tax=Gloeomargarita lithophora Alchichica-D10 TaxID=1188229 RepID=A0A1J0AAN8_9CYAN|nr:L-aspartate oxidase [Gloeomargarita lithophora]APB32969.1 L-aspartate oxidase [Gloeomargarita lithophora Alchichica-D10]
MSCASPPDFDVLVVGGGAAGLYGALSLPKALRVGLLTKDPLERSASGWAQGGIAAVTDPEDSWSLHTQDTLRAGAGLCDPEAVRFLVSQGGDCIQRLVALGVAFDRYGEGLALTLEAAHSRPRILHAADRTGRELVSTLAEQVFQQSHIQVLPEALVIDLWVQDGQCHGVRVWHRGELHTWRCGAVVVATGGGGQLFHPTTNPPASTGDGLAMAWRAGATLRDVEFVQFHPTALAVAGAPALLISEAVRGEGAHLLNHRGERFLYQYHPDGELAPRYVVSRAIFQELRHSGQCQVWLDLRPMESSRVERRFPNILHTCRQWGIDPLREPVPVAPAAHYWMGGIVTDLHARTTIPGLYAIGEVASTGVHGANRLASNSLLECLVFGAQLRGIALTAPPALPTPVELGTILDWPGLAGIRQDLPVLMGQRAGIARDAVGLNVGLHQVQQWRAEMGSFPPQGADFAQIRLWAETRNLLDSAYLVLGSALYRRESRGSHYRLDWPEPVAGFHAHTVIQGERWQLTPVQDLAA